MTHLTKLENILLGTKHQDSWR